MITNVKSLTMRLATFSVILLMAAQAHAQQGTARNLMKEALHALPKAPFTAHLKLTTDIGDVRELDVKHKVVDGSRATYLEVVAPESIKGIRFLFIEHPDQPPDQYMKVTAARTSVRVADQMRKRPFLGSAFYVADMVEPELDAYTYTFVGEQRVLDHDCTLIEAVPKNLREELYGKVVVAIDPNDKLILRRNFFDKDGEVLKVWMVEKVQKIDGFWTPMQQRMKNMQEKSESFLQITDVEYNVDIDDLVFTPKYLLR